MIEINGKNVADIVIDYKNVVKIQDAITLDIMWQKTSPAIEYFYVESEYEGEADFQVNTVVGSGTITGNHATTLEYSKDKENWYSFTLQGTKNIRLYHRGERIYFRNSNGYFNWYGGSSSDRFYTIFNFGHNFNVGGNINTLLDYTNINTVSCSPYCFYRLFHDETELTKANNLYLSTILDERCCVEMFQGCTSLTTAPILPATVLDTRCYEEMFWGCTSLTTAPILPATTLADYCYQHMFYGCTSLTSAPTLSATTLSYYCYSGMFNGCSSLTSAPSLPATTLANYCYTGMFRGCTSLTSAPTLSTTTLTQGCYMNMFNGCTSLTTAPTLQATSLISDCYREMFKGCSSLTSITSYANDISALNCLYNWLQNASSTGTFHNLGSATYPSGVSGIPSGWTEVHS